MAHLNQAFNPDEVPEDERTFEPLPAGEYQMQVIESEIKPTKENTGQMLVLTLEVLSGPHENRKVWDRLNIVNQNADTQRIAQRALADLCLAIGVPSVTDSEVLHFKPFTARIGIRQDKSGQYGPQNTVRYKAKGGVAPAQSSNPSTARQTQNAGAAATPQTTKPAGNKPWRNKGAAA